jgi:hypothetical protein
MTWLKVKSIGAWLAVVFVFLAAGYQQEGRSYSCHQCRNMKTQTITRFWFIPVALSQAAHQTYPIERGHTHDWYRYSRYRLIGYKGWLGASVACRSERYRDTR